MKTRPLWAVLSGPPSVQLIPENEKVFGGPFAKISVPCGDRTLTFTATRQVADAVQSLLSLEVIQDWHG